MGSMTAYRVAGFELPGAGGYHDWQSTCSDLQKLAADFPDTRYTRIGPTFQNREIPVLHVNSGAPGRKKVLIVGCHHAKEWISVEVPLAFAKTIASGSVKHRVLDDFSFVLVPMLNPDGHVYSTAPTTRLWRKNRSANGGVGVDLNRNYPVHWSEGLTSCKPDSDSFHGPRAFSETETCALRDLFRAVAPDLLVSYHSYGERVLYPPAFDPFVSRDPIHEAGRELSMAYLTGVNRRGGTYDICAARDHYGPDIAVGGDLCDWALQESGGTCLSLTVELSPASANPGFVLPASAIPGVVAQNWDGLLELLQTHRSIRP